MPQAKLVPLPPADKRLNIQQELERRKREKEAVSPAVHDLLEEGARRMCLDSFMKKIAAAKAEKIAASRAEWKAERQTKSEEQPQQDASDADSSYADSSSVEDEVPLPAAQQPEAQQPEAQQPQPAPQQEAAQPAPQPRPAQASKPMQKPEQLLELLETLEFGHMRKNGGKDKTGYTLGTTRGSPGRSGFDEDGFNYTPLPNYVKPIGVRSPGGPLEAFWKQKARHSATSSHRRK